MLVSYPWVLAYHSGSLFRGSAVKIHSFTAVARMEFGAMKVVFFLKFARDGSGWNFAESNSLQKNTPACYIRLKRIRATLSTTSGFWTLFTVQSLTLSFHF